MSQDAYGDVPCNEPCSCRWCLYNIFGTCRDNVPCERQTQQEDSE